MKLKKLLLAAVLALAVFIGLAVPTYADGAITETEHQIIEKLSAGITVGGKTFHVPGQHIARAENHLKGNELTDYQINSVLPSLDAITTLLEAQTIDVSGIDTLEDLIRAMPADVQAQLKNDHLSFIASILGLTITYGPEGISIIDNTATGKTTIPTPVASNNENVVKNTGSNYVPSILISLLTLFSVIVVYTLGKRKNYVSAAK
ncbi:hypothetical protein Hs30E_04220 [Lactococcus hodotermopsidis]|uniref:Gram-positive cocci surface proteins LPxTG domain-containing protein n=1 Tax=Pseudolactococcus hodotermopsidis TaxID=2709157 RepID=A0A6A0BBM5_9LACT|nr:hypothetical protein [Lactococcus hodotermopsidis]GFH41871.1 hypothetical protein Hs30E_04220 [Lactococcus hodotermopsidis]